MYTDRRHFLFSIHDLLILGVAHDDLKAFLENNVPVGKKKSKVVLGVADSKIGGSVQERVNIQCETGDAVPEILRGIRLHFHKMIEGKVA